MRKIALLVAAGAVVGLTSPAFAQDDEAAEGAVLGGTAGTAVGATAGAIVGGPVGAVIGGFAGATFGAAVGISAASYDYIKENPVEVIVIEGALEVGDTVPEEVEIHAIADEDRYGYFFANDRVYIVELDSGEIVESPGELVYVE